MNFIIYNLHFSRGDANLFFSNNKRILDEEVRLIRCPIYDGTGDKLINMFDILVKAQIFPSRNIARKNWKGCIDIPEGFSEFTKIGKHNKTITIFNPKEIKENAQTRN